MADDAGMDQRQLGPLGDLEAVPPTAKPGPFAVFIKGARRVLHAFLRPWLAAQTIYNRELARRFDETSTAVHDLERRAPLLERALHDLEARLRQMEAAPDRASPPPIDRASGAAAIAAMFGHSRLPRPPGRVLLLESDAAPALQEAALVSFGFTVYAVGRSAAATRSARSSCGAADRLPFRDRCFDAVLRLPAGGGRGTTPPLDASEVREIARVLKPGGRFIAVQPAPWSGEAGGDSCPRAEAVAAILRPLEISELLRASSQGREWRVVPGVDDALPGESGAAMLLIDARRPDVSPR
jgi:hypothetical protein